MNKEGEAHMMKGSDGVNNFTSSKWIFLLGTIGAFQPGVLLTS